jgi:hypothetical protein
MSGLDGLSSPRSSTSLGASTAQELVRRVLGRSDKKTFLASALITTRGMAHSVLNMANNQPMPRQGPGYRRVSSIFDLLILALSSVLVISIVRIPGWYRRLAQSGINRPSELSRRVGKTAVFHFTGPLALLFTALKVPVWIEIVLYLPDLVAWLYSVAVVLTLKGIIEIALIWRVFQKPTHNQALPPAAGKERRPQPEA